MTQLKCAFACLVLLSFLAGQAIAEPASSSAPGVVKALQTDLIQAMKRGDEWDYSERFRELEPAVVRAHHFERIARVTLGQHWTRLSKPERSEFIRVLQNLAVANMAGNFTRHQGERFDLVEHRVLDRGQKLVRTVMIRPGRPDIPFDYVLAPSNDEWRIINVVVDGVSDLALKRADYQSVLRRRSFSDLIEEIQSQIDALGGVPEPRA